MGRFGTLAIGIALARLLGPEAFGTFAVATVALLAMLSFNELGVSLAIVRWADDPENHRADSEHAVGGDERRTVRSGLDRGARHSLRPWETNPRRLLFG